VCILCMYGLAASQKCASHEKIRTQNGGGAASVNFWWFYVYVIHIMKEIGKAMQLVG
jgi:hypothetical protein